MSYNYDYDMKYTDNPYIDLLVHNTKIMAINSVVKNETEALNYETLESRSESDKMISYKQGHPIDPNYNPDDYVELNNYYRMLEGSPPFPSKAEIQAYQKENGSNADLSPLYRSKYIPLDQYQDMISDNAYIDIRGKYLHSFSKDSTTISILETYGIMDQIKLDYPGDDFKYIYYVGEKSIDPYTARTAENFSLLYVPMIQFEEIYYKYIRLFDRNREYTVCTIYSEAYAYGSLHYDNFIIILIIIQTMIDIITEVQEYIINKDVFDSRTIQYLFKSYGIDYYKEIPVRYQLAMIKNINKLIKYKSTNQNIVDICSLFGFPDIEVFTYYILKTKKKPLNEFEYNSDGTENFAENYELQFLRVPITDPNASQYLEDKSARRSYDYITNQDPFWDGISKSDMLSDEDKAAYHENKKNEILKQDFSCERTKYISIDASIDMTKMSYQLCYFMNILYDKHIDEEKLLVSVDSNMFGNNKSGKVKLNDLLTLGIALGYLYNGVEPDLIATDMEKNMTINGFNFDTDWNDIFNDLNNKIYIKDQNGDKMKVNGLGMLTELDSEFPGAFLSGRYKKCTCGKIKYDDDSFIEDDSELENFERIHVPKYVGLNPPLKSNGGVCVWNIYHGLETTKCVITLIDTIHDNEVIDADIRYVNNNLCQVTFSNTSVISAGKYSVLLISLEDYEDEERPIYKKKYSEKNPALNTNGSTCVWNITHNLNSVKCICNVVDNNNELIHVNINYTSNNTCSITFDSNTNIISNQYTMYIISLEETESDPTNSNKDSNNDNSFESIIWKDLSNHKIYDAFSSYDEYVYDGIDGLNYPKYLEPYLQDISYIKQFSINNPLLKSDGEKCVWEVKHGLETTKCIVTIIDNTSNKEVAISDISFVNRDTCEIILDSSSNISANRLTLILLGVYVKSDKIGYEEGTEFIYHTADLTWDTPYDPEQNSHGDFKNTSELNDMPEDSSDLSRFNKLKEIYTTNTNLYNHLIYMMNHAESKRMYDIYRTVFESFMETKFSTEFYDVVDSNGNNIYYIDDKNDIWTYDIGNQVYSNKNTDITYPAETKIDDKGNEYICPISSSPLKKLTAETYYDFFKYRDMRLYEILIKASSGFKNKDEQKAYISRICDYIVYALNKYFNSSDWKYIYNVIPTHNLEFIQKCILKVINFFKSWRTQMLDQSVDYIFNDPYQNYVHILDDTLLYSTIDLFDKPSPYDFNETLNHLEFKEKTTPKDYIEFSYYTDQN